MAGRRPLAGLPFTGVSDRGFAYIYGGNGGRRPPHQRITPVTTTNPNRAMVDNWRINEVPFDEPSGHYHHRLEVSFNASYIVPSAPNMRARDPYREFDPILDSLFPTRGSRSSYALRPWFNIYRPSRFRVYFLHPDGSMQTLENGEPRVFGGNVFTNDPTGMRALRESFASTLAEFVDEYEDEDIINGDLQYVRMYIDLTESFGGAAYPKTLPHDFPVGVLWTPNGYGNCAFKCLAQAVRFHRRGLKWQQMKTSLAPLVDDCDAIQLMKLFVKKYPEYSVRLLSVTGYLRHREDGDRFEYEQDSLRNPGGLSRQRYCVYLLLEDRHYYLIQMVYFFIRIVRDLPEAQYCHGCCLIFNNTTAWQNHQCRDDHVCERCQMFFNVTYQKDSHRQHNPMDMDARYCEYCGQNNFYSEECFTHHQLHCTARRVAQTLERYRRANERNPTCSGCAKKFPGGSHICYMTSKELPEREKFDEMYAFDFECMLIPANAGTSLHQINKVCVQQVYNPDAHWSFNTATEFIEWMYQHCFERPDLVFGFFAHNLKGYDGRLMLCEIYKFQRDRDASHIEDMIWVGAKINTFKWKNVKFRDSLLHLPMPLAALPGAFGLEAMQKGHFPYLFNTPANQDYVGPMPPLELFEPQYKSPKERKELVQWYQREVARGELYDFKRVLEDYCLSDVDILARALEKYNEAGRQLNHPQLPPLDKMTIASYTLNCWRTLHFPDNTLINHANWQNERARAALRGGRTDVRCFYKKWTMEDVFVRGRYGKYVDIVSMYPYVMYTYPMPIGAPQCFEEEDCTLEMIMDPREPLGFAEVDINPPDRFTFIPVTVHTAESGRLVGQLKPWHRKAFCLTELRDMINDGWEIQFIYWIQMYDSNADMFKEYISKLICEKTQASKSPEYYDRTHEEWLRRFNVRLDRSKMARNDGIRSIAKLQVNSLWGKLAERAKHDFCFNVDREDFLHYENLELLGDVRFKHKLRISNNSWLISGTRESVPMYTKVDTENRCNTSVPVGAHVTMWARRLLTQEMKRLGKRTLYHDTDSIIYDYDSSASYNTPTGEFLGEWEEELPGCAMIEFVALAPKTYSYRYIDLAAGIPIPENASMDFFSQYPHYEIWQDKLYVVNEKIKVKGMKLHDDALRQINFNGLLELYSGVRNVLSATQLQFKFDRDRHEITTKHFQKDLVFQYEKGLRGIAGDPYSYPFGSEHYWVDGQVEEGDLIRRRSSSFAELDDNS